MKQNYRASMIQLHTYAGLFMGWLLFAIFLTGTLSYFSNEISHWMRGVVAKPTGTYEQIEHAYDHLLSKSPGSHSWRIGLADNRGSPLSVQWRDNSGRHSLNLPNESGQTKESKATRGGRFFVTFHYTLQLRQYGGRYLAGLAAMTMLIALYSGIFTHRRLIKDFFTLRTRSFVHLLKDSHAVSGIVTIPFVIIICLSALVIYINLFAPWFAEANFEQGYRQMSKEVSETLPTFSENTQPATPIKSLALIIDQAEKIWPETIQFKSIRLDHPFQNNGRVIVEGINLRRLTNNTDKLVFSSVSGELLGSPASEGFARQTRRVLYGLHEGHFFQLDLRWLSFFQGALATFLIASGMIIWVTKRADKGAAGNTSLKSLSKLNLIVFGGLPLACLMYFTANRLLPANQLEREAYELLAFNYTLLFALIFGLVLNKKVTTLLFSTLACVASFLIVIADFRLLLTAIEQRDTIYLGVGTSMWLTLFTSTSLVLFLVKRYRMEE